MYVHSLASQTQITEIEGELVEEGASARVDNTSFDNYGYDDEMGITLAQPEKVETWKRIHDEQKNRESLSSSALPETDNNMVQSVKSLQNHKQRMVGTSQGNMTDIEESAMFGNVDQFHEGIYTDSVLISDADKLSLEVEESVRKGFSVKDALLKAIRKSSCKGGRQDWC